MHAFPGFFFFPEHTYNAFAILATHLKSVTLYYNAAAQMLRTCNSNEE